MSWENYGKIWNIDHIKAVSKFHLNEIEKANHFSNLQPMFCKDNIRKSNK